MNVETGTVAAQFPEKEYINGIFVAVHQPDKSASPDRVLHQGAEALGSLVPAADG